MRNKWVRRRCTGRLSYSNFMNDCAFSVWCLPSIKYKNVHMKITKVCLLPCPHTWRESPVLSHLVGKKQLPDTSLVSSPRPHYINTISTVNFLPVVSHWSKSWAKVELIVMIAVPSISKNKEEYKTLTLSNCLGPVLFPLHLISANDTDHHS